MRKTMSSLVLVHNASELTNSSDIDEWLTSLHCSGNIFVGILLNYVTPVLFLVGILLNMFCVLIFAQILLHRSYAGHMYKYLLVKAVHDAVHYASGIFENLYDCESCGFGNSYVGQLWYIWMLNYVEYINEFCSGFLEIAATFDCYITINKKFKWCLSIVNFYTVCITMLVFSAVFNLYNIFCYEIKEKVNAKTMARVYFIEYTPFYYSGTDVTLYKLMSLVRDLWPLVMLIGLNSLILISMHRTTQRKRRLVAPQTSTSMPMPTGLVSNAERAERHKIFMIVVTGVNYAVGHTPILFYTLIYNTTEMNSVFWTCYIDIALFFFYVSYATSFFIYYHFNSSFQRLVNKKIPRVMRRPSHTNTRSTTMNSTI